MIRTEVSFTSLCYVEEGYNGRIWLHRFADIENGRLSVPFKSNRVDNYFENRERLYWNNGPSAIGFVGVWDWSAIPNRDNPELDYVQSCYVPDISPIRVIVVAAKSLKDLTEQLMNGNITVQPYFCDTLFCYQAERGQLTGVLCRANEFEIVNGDVIIQDNVYFLPHYSISINDIFNWDDKNLRFLDELQSGIPSGYVTIRNTYEIIRKLILERSTRNLIKTCFGVSNAQWNKCKDLVARVCDGSLYELVALTLKCTYEQAKQAVDDFVTHANTLIDAGDIDADVLARIALNHDELRQQCEKIISSKWQETHAAEIAKTEQEIEAAEQRLSSTEENLKELGAEIDAAQKKLDQLHTEIEKYEAIGQDTLAATQLKIADAQKDVSEFIASISMFLPQANAMDFPGKSDFRWRYICADENPYSKDDIEIAEDWNDEFYAISQNLATSLKVESEFCTMLAACLYSAHINNVSILIAGPHGCDIAKLLSVSLYARSSGNLILGNECDYDIIDEIKDYSEQIVAVQNMFGKGWFDALPQVLGKLQKQIVWTHPYVEDMIIEPKGLYNYMLPILSECFIGMIPSLDLTPGKRADNFKEYTPPPRKHSLRIAAFKRLGLSKLLLNQLEAILSDAKEILGDPAKEKDMEILFGLLPLSVLTGRCDVLKETIESENGISSSVKTEVARYIEEE